jgi:serine/threonine protein kinase/Tfp pilus assembly protein PilF
MDIFAEAMELPGSRRAAFLDSTCAGEPNVRREVDKMLACADRASAVFDAAAQQIIQPDPEAIGPYQLLEPIGEGGMAIVYKAQQHHPVKRIVALKLIKLGMDTRQFVARFESERQALAMMDHPNVARVYDAGSTEGGRPYFVMEYVAGEPILRWCDARQLPLAARLELFIAVCDAVEHAHRKGIIHRDLKDSNVLVAEVDGRALPKVIDFGVAKAISQRLTDGTMFTEQGQLIGTPEYMSPEQAERGGLDIDTRSDVYSLGVLLYELIAGVQPISSDVWRRGSFEQVQRIIREREPPRPSTQLGTLGSADAARIAQRRRSEVAALIRHLRSELEWIPLKAMRKDREQRYRSASELGDDIRNYLAGRPLIAGPESAGYKLRKFLRRHKAGVAASAAMVVLLIAGIIATTWQAVRATRAEGRTSQERDNARATLDFFTDAVFAGAIPENQPDKELREQIINAMITPAAKRVGELSDRPLIEASVRATIQTVLREVGRSDIALPHAEAALAIRRRVLGEDHPDTIASLSDYATVLWSLGRAAEAQPLHEEALARRRRVLGEDDPATIDSLNNCASVLEALGRAADAEPIYEEALKRCSRVLGDNHPATIGSLNNYASVLSSLGRSAEAESFCKQALERSRRGLGEDHALTVLSRNRYAAVLSSLGRAAEAEPLSREALESRRRVLGEQHPATIRSLSTYATMVSSLGRWAEAEPLHRQALEQSRRGLGEDHPDTITTLNNYGFALQALGRAAEAEPLFNEALVRSRRVLGEDHPDTISSIDTYASVLYSLGRPGEAAPLFAQALEKWRRVLGEDHPDAISSLNNYAGVLHALGRATEAEPLHREAYERSRRALGEDHVNTIAALRNYAGVLVSLGRAAEAEPLARQAVERATAHASLGPRHPRTLSFAVTHANSLEALGRSADAAAVRQRFGLPQPTAAPSTVPTTSPASATASR